MHIVMEKALKTVQRRNLLCPGDTVFVALSGGADSMALLYVMSDLKESLSLSGIRAMHLHHGLRGTEADRDEQFVREQCGRLGISLTVCHADVKKEAAKAHESCEQAGRRLRYRFFAEQAKAVTGAKIATAHTADDQTETV
ncbi:MAG: tRNA lysidine(34) synthetase TilS, partial [Acutalibacteraceae bacterium]